MILEEDWALCPLFLPQPCWGDGVRKGGEAQHEYTGIGAESLKLMRCAAYPPRNTSQYSGTLFKIASEKHRSALAAMSRNVAASLALLRLPAAACSCHCRCPQNDLAVHGEIRTACSLGQCSVNRGSSACVSPMNQRNSAEGQEAAADAELCGCLQLALRHLRVASEEGEKLGELLRFNGEKLESSKVCDTVNCSEGAAPPPAERDKPSDEQEQPLQPSIASPVQCLEVYTAVGQDSITNKRRFQEEEGLKEAFADDDPIVRERSQITLRELEMKLKTTEKERQRVPRVLKELSLTGFDNIDGSDCKAAEDRAIVRVVTESSNDMGCFSAADSRIQGFPLGEPKADVHEKATPLFTNVIEGDVNAKSGVQQGFVGVAPLNTEKGVLEGVSQPEGTEDMCRLGGVGCLDDEEVAFQIRLQDLKGCSAGNISYSPETLATRSLMLQLRRVLKRQRRTLAEERDSSPAIATPLETPPGSNESGTVGDSMDYEDWSACDGVEGPSCAAEAPTWGAAFPHSADTGGDGLNRQKGDSM
ncbi:hypothetical protein, conserved [Eimeria brunetti]|uniref:Uncharacterized protein n=1 Tax=Eimeria brunetti TaxID=51314 RepID=U6LNS8_9EIME|nr:hypothetical protein, conserved [Eimeria brunetti]